VDRVETVSHEHTCAILAKDVRKSYGAKSVLTGLDLSVVPGDICAVLGRNGAGKTTLLKILLGLAPANSGEIRVYGETPGRANSRIAYLCENIALYPHLSARDNLRVAALAGGLPDPAKNDIGETLERVDLAAAGAKPARSFSLGMKRRLQLAMALLIKPADLMILDEPTNGLDVDGLLWLKQLLRDLRREGLSVLVASHAMAEMQDIVTSYAILSDGVIKARETWSPDSRIVHCHIGVASGDVTRALAALSAETEGAHLTAQRGVELETTLPQARVHEILHRADVVPEYVTPVVLTLEDVFLSVTGEAAR